MGPKVSSVAKLLISETKSNKIWSLKIYSFAVLYVCNKQLMFGNTIVEEILFSKFYFTILTNQVMCRVKLLERDQLYKDITSETLGVERFLMQVRKGKIQFYNAVDTPSLYNKVEILKIFNSDTQMQPRSLNVS